MKSPWSIKFSDKHFSQFKFCTGDGKHWMVMDKNQVYGFYENENRTIRSSSTS